MIIGIYTGGIFTDFIYPMGSDRAARTALGGFTVTGIRIHRLGGGAYGPEGF